MPILPLANATMRKYLQALRSSDPSASASRLALMIDRAANDDAINTTAHPMHYVLPHRIAHQIKRSSAYARERKLASDPAIVALRERANEANRSGPSSCVRSQRVVRLAFRSAS